MRTLLLCGFLTAGLALGSSSLLRAQTYVDNFNDGSRTDGSPSTWVIGNATSSTLSVVSNALQVSAQNASFGTDLPTAFSLSTSSLLTLSFSLQFTGTQELRLGLFNNGGTPLGTTDGAIVGTNTAVSQGIYIDLQPDSYASPTALKVQAAADGGTNGGIFFGMDRTFGSTQTVTGTILGTTVHQVQITFELSGARTGIFANVYLDGTLIANQTISTASLANLIGTNGINEIIGYVPSNTGATGNVLIDDITLTNAVPEPKAIALFGMGGGLLALAVGRRVLNGLPLVPVPTK